MMRQIPVIVTNALYFLVFIGPVLALVIVYFRSAERRLSLKPSVRAGGSGTLATGGVSSCVLFALGWIICGIAGWRAGMFPAWAVAAFVVAGLLGYMVR